MDDYGWRRAKHAGSSRGKSDCLTPLCIIPSTPLSDDMHAITFMEIRVWGSRTCVVDWGYVCPIKSSVQSTLESRSPMPASPPRIALTKAFCTACRVFERVVLRASTSGAVIGALYFLIE
ncbi:hypothetical protein K505DRAFT_133239 [Melanomma pulvis-pyrius CBS 109.77]|uniref:Uncharacterized protein n=1 Tax=Melanomma pulvis-pyrius CBS 109.77 TaxID=1314802 RepID=A0A6A6WSG3_9PLEO|nr:hypothetical protein K505DRAFT_133239 [Melanomma pulvis-pyrius CBS 109.77]